MIKNLLVGSAAAQVVNQGSAFCGCSSCAIDWKEPGIQALIGGVACDDL
jgi:hypothetical protein